jgi:hypothetical protein
MPNLYYNSLQITGAFAARQKFIDSIGINSAMVDVDDGASDIDYYDQVSNDESHKAFIANVRDMVGIRIDRVRLRSLSSGLEIAYDLWGTRPGAVVHSMALRFPLLRFELIFFNDRIVEYQIVFESGQWTARRCEDPSGSGKGPVEIEIVASGDYADYSDVRLFPVTPERRIQVESTQK